MSLRRERVSRRADQGDDTSQRADPRGPVDYLVVQFPTDGTTFSSELVDELSALSAAGLIVLLDAVVLQKAFDGTVEHFEIEELGTDALRSRHPELTSVLASEDIDRLAGAMKPGTVAGIVVWENRWVSDFASVAQQAGGRVIAVGGITPTAQHESTGSPDKGAW
jgi:hypothetical protein